MVFNDDIVRHPNGHTRDEMESELMFLEQDFAGGEMDENEYMTDRDMLNMFLTDDDHWQEAETFGRQTFFDPAYEEIKHFPSDPEPSMEMDFLEYEKELIADKPYEKMQRMYNGANAPKIKQDREITQEVFQITSEPNHYVQKQMDLEVDNKTYEDYGIEL